MIKRLLCALLCVALCLSPALAAAPEADAVMEAAFPVIIAYSGFGDVAAGSWYESAAKTCADVGLIGSTKRGFEPEKPLTVAECTVIAARIRAALAGAEIPRATPLPGEERPWYLDYLDYLCAADPGLRSAAANAAGECSRALFVRLLSAAVAGREELLPPINQVAGLPDCEDEQVLAFYNAGILIGKDPYGSFDGEGTLTRAEGAAMTARLVRPAQRLRFTLERPAPGAEHD